MAGQRPRHIKVWFEAGGARNEGINIAVPEGTSVRAADGGVVAYAGNELRVTAISFSFATTAAG